MKKVFFVSLMVLGTTLGVVSCGEKNEKTATQEAKSEVTTENVATDSVKQDTVVLDNQK